MGQQVTVYLMRAEVDPAVLRGGSVEEILRVFFDQGLVGPPGDSELALGDIRVDGDQASAEVLSDGLTAPFSMAFLREDGTWKVDFEPLLSLAEELYRSEADSQGMSTDEWIDDFLVTLYGPEKAAALRNPVSG